MLPGSRIAWDVHYASTDEDVTDAVEMGVYFYPKGQEPKYRQTLLSVGSSGEALDIPPNSVVAHEGYFVLPKAARIESFQPHMHLRGKAQSLEAILPTGQKVMLSHVANFNFNWHNAYVYADDAAPLLPKGTVLKATSWHDNTAANKSNPDPERLGGLRRPHGRRDEPHLDEPHLSRRSRLSRRSAGRSARLTQQQQQQ